MEIGYSHSAGETPLGCANYYAWGLEMPGRVYVIGAETEEGFTGHERDAESQMLYAGARYYLPALGRWTAVDPLADQFPSVSPYNYAANNPVSLFDPDGRAPACCLGQSDPEGRSVGQVARGAPGPAGYRERNRQAGRAVVAAAGAIGVGLTPAGVAVDAYDMGTAVSERDVMGGVLAGVGFIPGSGDAVKKIGQGLRKLFRGGNNAIEVTTSFGKKIERQMGRRGWSQEDVAGTISKPFDTKSLRDTRHLPDGTQMDDAATAYIREDGSYVIRNDKTGDVVQVSNRNDPNWRAPWDEEQ